MVVMQKGQAFDVFKLLIAAVVAIAILLILQQTLQVIPGIGEQGAGELASRTVKSKINDIGNPQIVENVTFKPGDSLNAKTIALASGGLSEEQVCVTLSGSAPNASNFEELNNGRIVKYSGQSAQKTRLLVLCDREKELESTLSDYGYADEFDITITQCSLDSTKTQKYCVVAVISES